MVTMLRDRSSISLRVAYRVVVLPLPVGPAHSTMPNGERTIRSYWVCVSPGMPSWASLYSDLLLSRTRMTHFSPKTVAIVETRTSIPRPSTSVANWPSWALRRSTMFMSARILTRLTRAPAMVMGRVSTSCRVPSIRNRTRSSPSVGSRWMSDARSRRASVTSMVTTLATGESAPIVSSRARFRGPAGRVDRGKRFDHPVYIGEGPVGPIEGLASGAGRHHIQLKGAADGLAEFGFHARSGVADDDFDDAVDFA